MRKHKNMAGLSAAGQFAAATNLRITVRFMDGEEFQLEASSQVKDVKIAAAARRNTFAPDIQVICPSSGAYMDDGSSFLSKAGDLENTVVYVVVVPCERTSDFWMRVISDLYRAKDKDGVRRAFNSLIQTAQDTLLLDMLTLDCGDERPAIAEALSSIAGASVESGPRSASTKTLCQAVFAGHMDEVKLRLQQRKDKDRNYDYHDEDPRPALYLALKMNRPKIVALLVRDAGIDIHERRVNDYAASHSCLQYAVSVDNEALVRVLLSAKADPKQTYEICSDGCCWSTPLHLAVYHERLDIIAMLVRAGADVHQTESHYSNRGWYKSVLTAAREKGHEFWESFTSTLKPIIGLGKLNRLPLEEIIAANDGNMRSNIVLERLRCDGVLCPLSVREQREAERERCLWKKRRRGPEGTRKIRKSIAGKSDKLGGRKNRMQMRKRADVEMWQDLSRGALM